MKTSTDAPDPDREEKKLNLSPSSSIFSAEDIAKMDILVDMDRLDFESSLVNPEDN